MEASDASFKAEAAWQTTSRLLAAIINEGLVKVAVSKPAEGEFRLHIGPFHSRGDDREAWIMVSAHPDIGYPGQKAGLSLPISPVDLMPAVYGQTGGWNHLLDLAAEAIFNRIFPWFGYQPINKTQIMAELKSSTTFQECWLKEAAQEQMPSLASSAMDWEMAIIRGHPTHPGHRALLAQTPLAPIVPEDLPHVKEPEVVFISVPRDYITTVGPFDELLRPFIEEHGVALRLEPQGRIVLPCLKRQLPSTRQQLREEVFVLPSKALCGQAQSSLRTISLPSSQAFNHDLKLALACHITSALRTITPWTALIGPELSKILELILPTDIWVCHELAAATGSQPNFDIAKHISVLVRENPEGKARAQGETLIVAAALAEKGVDGGVCHAERVFGLSTQTKKEEWFRNYTSKLLHCVLPPIFHSGISLEAHSQNILARFNVESKALVGFAYRDFGGLKLHTPTLAKLGYEITTSPAGSLILTENMQELYENCHHTIFQSHLNQFVQALHLSKALAWAVVRQEIAKVLRPEGNGQAKGLYEFLMQDTVPYKCFMRMKMQGLYRDYIHHDVPNVILR